MTDQMDVDVPTSSTLQNLFASSSFKKLDLARLDLDALNASMKRHCSDHMWGNLIGRAGDDVSRWQPIISSVLMFLTMELAATDVKHSIIARPNYGVADEIVMGFSEDELEQWKAGVRSGVETNDWIGLITHPKLRKRKVPLENVAPGVPIKLQDAVVRAWGMEYHGDVHKILLQTVDSLHALPIEHNYAKIVPIVQSSGTGKSKTVDKVATERILFPICIREDIGKHSFAYPPTDTVVREHLSNASYITDETECKQYLKSFLSSLFASAHLQARQLFPGLEKVSYERMASVFYDSFANQLHRNSFYEEVIANAKKGPYIEVWKSFKNLKNYLEEHCSNWPPTTLCPLLVSIDEVHVLYTHRKSDYTIYSCLKSVLDQGVSQDFGIITVSTASPPSFPPSKEIAWSGMQERILAAPFTEVPFDVHIIAKPLAPGQAKLTSVGSLEFTAKFGRPLFYASYLSRKGREERGNILEGIMSNVREKLSGRYWPPEAPADLDLSSIAVISARLLLDLSLSPAADSKRYEEELVRKHLRMLYSVDENRQIIVTGSSSEPLLAEASAQMMHYSIDDKKMYMDLWGLLGKFVDHGFADLGDIGTLIGRALSISAMDRAIHGLPKVCELEYQTPVTVADYYKAFLTDEAWDALRQSTPANRARLSDNSAKKTFEDAFQDAYFHFSHYGKANDSTPMRSPGAWALWLRGSAVVCQFNQELTDRMTPIYFSSLGNVSPKTISVNLDQDQTGQSANPVDATIQSAEDLCIFSYGHKLPYIAAVHCYALTENQGITVTKPGSHDLRVRKKKEDEAPRYQIDFRGLSAYGNITNAVRIAIRMMINHSENALFNDHPRQYGVPLLRQMLPALTKDPASTAWFGGIEKAETWNAEAGRRKDSTAGSSTARVAKRN